MLKGSLFNKILNNLCQHFLPDSIRTAKRLGAILYVIFIIVFHLQILLSLKWSVPVFCSRDLANVSFTDICPVYHNMCSTDVLAFRAMSGLINYALWSCPAEKGVQFNCVDASCAERLLLRYRAGCVSIWLTRAGIASVCSLKVGTQITPSATLIW